MVVSKFSLSIFSLVLFAFSLSPELAQTQDLNLGSITQDLEYGFTAGINYSGHQNTLRFYTGNVVLDLAPDHSAGLFGGFFVRHEITETVRIQAEPTLTRLGVKINWQSINVLNEEFEIEGKSRVTYLQIPVTVQLTTVNEKTGKTIYGRPTNETTFHALAGLYWGMMLNATFKGNHNGPADDIQLRRNFNENFSDHYYRHDGGFIIGGGLEHGHEQKIGAELRTFYSPFDTGKDWGVLDFNPKNLGVSIAFYYKI